ncbi:MAG: hypothetical protein KF845_06635 [Cyclobacteriaceae bacterium]|nr:hypothetical protein [Cyclobacteriaceae bacterium]
MSTLIVRAKPWQIFLVFAGVITFYGIIPDDQQILNATASILLAVIFFGWFLIVGMSLNKNLPEDEQKPDTLFTISCFYGIVLVSVSALLKNLPVNESLTGYAIALVISFGVSSFYMIYFTSILYSINQERFLKKGKLNAELVFILFIGFILGILVLQSRIRKIFSQS